MDNNIQSSKEGIEELLTRLRKEHNWSYLELMSKLKNKTITDKDIKKWEVGLKYPDLDMIYDLSELYQIPSEDLIKAKEYSYTKKGVFTTRLIKWICYFLNVSMYTAFVLEILIYIGALTIAFLIFMQKIRIV